MNFEITKIDLAKKLFNTNNESVLKQIQDILEKEEIVAYSINGKPLTRTEYIKEIKAAEKDIENGNYISHSQLLENIKTW
ncbi:MAG: hypothetical protein GXO89_15625 [Chlorobi bacterium]|nr:hypothetical protein [Chlorobiota bacterium]